MKKVYSAVICAAVIGWAGCAMALPSDYEWTAADFFTPTDLTTSVNGNSQFSITYENAAWESAFGLYDVNGRNFKIFSGAQEPGAQVTVTYKLDNGDFYASKDGIDWTELDAVFGFYFKTIVPGGDDYWWYTEQSKNFDGLEHIKVAFNDYSKEVMIFLDDQPGGGDRDFNDMKIRANDLAPVPEPTTMLLFGAGLAGLAAVGRRRKN